MTVTRANLLAGIPATLRDELLRCYDEICRNYAEHRWEPSELNGGKFCEVVFTIVEGAGTGQWPPNATKPKKMVDACKRLEQVTTVPRSLQILIPRLLPALYEIRNNRGVGHVGGDVDPNRMDATAVLSMSTWIMAELVRVFHNVSVDDAEAAVAALVERRLPLVWEVGGTRRVLDPSMKATKQVLILTYGSTAPVAVTQLANEIEYVNVAQFRYKVLLPLHKKRIVEFDRERDTVTISPKGIQIVEEELLAR